MKAEEFYLQRAVWGEGFPETDEPRDKQIYIDRGGAYVP